jgi:hypothetical protein
VGAGQALHRSGETAHSAAPEDTPRGHCFENAGTLVILLNTDEPAGQRFRERVRALGLDPAAAVVVHGVATHRPQGYRFKHAWVEVGNVVIDVTVSLDFPTYVGPRDDYYALGKIRPEECRRYCAREVFSLGEQFQHWGPWAPAPDNVQL